MSHKNLLNKIFSKYKTFFFDCDGVLWNGSTKIESNFWILNHLKQMNKQIYFISNNCTRTKDNMKEKFNRYGYDIDLDQIYMSANMTAQFIKIEYPQVKKVYCIGMAGIKEELHNVGIDVIDSDLHNDLHIDQDYAMNGFYDTIENVDAVVVGFDNQFNYYKQCYAINCFKKNPDCLFFATDNSDACELDEHITVPAGKSLYQGIQLAAKLEDPIVITKPCTIILKYLMKKDQLQKEDMIMVGDTIHTDIEMARKFGIDSILLYTGQSHAANRDEIENQLKFEQQWIDYERNNILYRFNSFDDPQ